MPCQLCCNREPRLIGLLCYARLFILLFVMSAFQTHWRVLSTFIDFAEIYSFYLPFLFIFICTINLSTAVNGFLTEPITKTSL
jgi:hypothetical protein